MKIPRDIVLSETPSKVSSAWRGKKRERWRRHGGGTDMSPAGAARWCWSWLLSPPAVNHFPGFESRRGSCGWIWLKCSLPSPPAGGGTPALCRLLPKCGAGDAADQILSTRKQTKTKRWIFTLGHLLRLDWRSGVQTKRGPETKCVSTCDHHRTRPSPSSRSWWLHDWLNGNQTASRVGYEQVCLVTKCSAAVASVRAVLCDGDRCKCLDCIDILWWWDTTPTPASPTAMSLSHYLIICNAFYIDALVTTL